MLTGKGHIEGFASPGEHRPQGGMFGDAGGGENVMVPMGKYSKMIQVCSRPLCHACNQQALLHLDLTPYEPSFRSMLKCTKRL